MIRPVFFVFRLVNFSETMTELCGFCFIFELNYETSNLFIRIYIIHFSFL